MPLTSAGLITAATICPRYMCQSSARRSAHEAFGAGLYAKSDSEDQVLLYWLSEALTEVARTMEDGASPFSAGESHAAAVH